MKKRLAASLMLVMSTAYSASGQTTLSQQSPLGEVLIERPAAAMPRAPSTFNVTPDGPFKQWLQGSETLRSAIPRVDGPVAPGIGIPIHDGPPQTGQPFPKKEVILAGCNTPLPFWCPAVENPQEFPSCVCPDKK